MSEGQREKVWGEVFEPLCGGCVCLDVGYHGDRYLGRSDTGCIEGCVLQHHSIALGECALFVTKVSMVTGHRLGLSW